MAIRYRHAAGLHWPKTLAEIERVKHTYQMGVKSCKEEEN